MSSVSSVTTAAAGATTIPEFFRAVNERIRELAWPVLSDYDLICECNDSSCMRLLRMQAEEYEALRADQLHFAVIPGHERYGRNDRVIVRTERFVIVGPKTNGASVAAHAAVSRRRDDSSSAQLAAS
jgi:hypothetical protein